MKKQMRRSLALLLTLCMLLTALPAGVLAAGTLAPAEGWTVMNESDNYQINDTNSISITTHTGDFVNDGNNPEPRSYWLTDAPEGDFLATVKISGGMSENYQKAGILIYKDAATITSVVRRSHSGLGGNVVGMFQYQHWSDSIWGEPCVADPAPQEDIWLRIVKTGTTFSAFYSQDNVNWEDCGELENEYVVDTDELKVGVFAVSGNQEKPMEVTFTDFVLNGEQIDFAAEAASVPASKIVLSENSWEMEEGASYALTATVIPDYATDKTVIWESSDESVATVDEGVVTAVAEGSATITATCGDVSASCALTVYPAIKGVQMYLSDMDYVSCDTGWGSLGLDKGVNGEGGISLGGTAYEKGIAAHASSEIVYDLTGLNALWFLSDIGINDVKEDAGDAHFIVQIDGTEVYRKESVTGADPAYTVRVEIPEGAQTLTLITDTNGSDNSDHTVWAGACLILDDSQGAPVTGIELDQTKVTMDANDTVTLTAAVSPENAVDKTVTWSTSNDYVATVENGIVTAHRSGTATITATAGSFSATCDVTVTEAVEYLCDWDADSYTVSVGWGGLGIHQGVIPVSGEAESLRLKNAAGVEIAYEHGLSAHTDSQLVFDIDGKGVTAFLATVGNNGNRPGECGYIVLADEQVLFEQVIDGESPGVQVAVAVPDGAKTLTLKTTRSTDSDADDHSTWFDPRVIIGAAETYVPVTGVSLDKEAVTVNVGTMANLTATVTPGNATDKSVVWHSSNEAVAAVEDGIVTGIAAGTATITVTAMNYSASCTVTVEDPSAETELQYLCEEPWYDANVITVGTGWGGLGVHTGVINPNTNQPDGGSYIKIGGVTYDHGFAAHAASQIVFDIENMGVTTFSAIIGLHNDRGGTCGFTVMADKEVLYSVDSISGGETRTINVRVPEGARELILTTTDGGDGNSYDHSVWAMPAVTVDKAAADDLRRVNLTTPGFMKAEEEAYATVDGEMVDGTPADLTSADITYTSDNPDVLTVDGNGVLTIQGRGTANITVTVTLDGITRTATNMITVDDGSGERAWELASPNGEVKVSLSMGEDNDLHYSAVNGGKVIVGDSMLGIKTDLADFDKGLLWVDSEIEEVRTSYTMISGKASQIDNHYNELTLNFAKGEAVFTVYVRAYDDGYAYRYSVSKTDGGQGDLRVYGETGTFDLPEGSTLFMMDNADRWDHKFNHEGSYETIALEEVYDHLIAHEESHNNIQKIYASMPLLSESADGLWTLITEANLYGDAYVGSYLDPIDASGTMQVAIPDQQEYWTGHAEVRTAYPFTSPWRVAISGELGDIVESTMVTDVSDDPYTDMDWSWVEPGVTSWTWLSEGLAGQKEEEVVREYVDLAYEMGWKYYIMDEGWQPTSQVAGKRYDGYYEWFDEMVVYAAERDVGLVAWILAHDLDTPEEREVLKEYAEKGIVGIKVDFFDIDDQDTIKLYKDIYDACVENHLIVNAHGANKPTGEARTYPNVINREAVAGQEFGSVNAYQSTYWPFIRNVVGSMDITPRITPSGGTASRMASLNVMFESGMPCQASSTDEILESAAYSLLKGLPSAWDEIHYIDGYPGQFATLARRSGDTWYAASINSNDQARTAEFPLDFLEEGVSYCAVIYRDGSNNSEIVVEYKSVTSQDTLSIPMSVIGGCTVKLLPLEEGNTVESIRLPEEVVLTTGESMEIGYTVAPEAFADSEVMWTVDDPSIATVDGNVVTARGVGVTTVTATSTVNPMVSAVCIIRVPGEKYVPAEGWVIENPASGSNQSVVYEDNANKITLKAVTGDLDYNGNAKNVWLRDAPDGDFELTVKVSGDLTSNYEKVGLVAYHDATNSVSAVRRYHSSFGGNVFGMFSYLNGYLEPSVKDTDISAPAYLKLVKTGNVFTGYYSWDGSEWISSGSVTNPVVGESGQLQIGVYCVAGSQGSGTAVDIENFTCNGTLIPFTQAKTTRDVVMIGFPGSVTVDAIEDNQVIGEIIAYLDNGEKLPMSVAWEVPDYLGAPGSYYAEGTVFDVEGVNISENLKPHTTVIVTGVNVTGISLDQTEVKLEIGESVTLTATVEPADAACKDVMWVSLNPEVAVVDENGRITALSAGTATIEVVTVDGSYSAACEVTVPEELEPPVDHDAVCASKKFTDVNLDAWYHEALDYVLDNGVMQGVEDTLFAPDSSLTRAMLVQILYNWEGKPGHSGNGTFSDVAENQWFYDAVTWAAEKGIVNGYDNGCFGPDEKITREQLVTIIWRYAGSPDAVGETVDFVDAADVDAYAVEAVIWATENGIVQGIGDNQFDPNGYSTRAQAAKLIRGYLEFISD